MRYASQILRCSLVGLFVVVLSAAAPVGAALGDLDPSFIWTANVGQIIAKIERARIKMEQIKPGSTLPRGKRKPVHV